MTEVETTLRGGLAALAADTEARVSPPPVEAITHRPVVVALAPWRRRRLLKTVVGVGAGIAVAAGAAAATGVLPLPVADQVAEFREWGYPAGDATLMATAEGEAGTYELWLSLLHDGGYCYYVRLVGSPLRGEDGAGSACSHEMLPAGPGAEAVLLGGYPGQTRPGDDVVYGRVPAGSTAVDVALGDGTSFRVEAQTDGWFVAVVPSSVADGISIDLRRTG